MCWCCAGRRARGARCQAHRKARAEAGLPKVTTDNFAYAALVYVGDSDEEGRRVGSQLLWFLNTSLKSAPQYSRFLPGAVPPEMAPSVYRTAPRADAALPANAEKGVTPASQNARRLISITVEQAMEQGILFAGDADGVYRQIMEFHDKVGGFGHLGADRPLRSHDPRGIGEGHPQLRQGRAAAAARGEAGDGGVGSSNVRPFDYALRAPLRVR